MKRKPSTTTVSFWLDSKLASDLIKKAITQWLSLNEYTRDIFLDALAERELRDDTVTRANEFSKRTGRRRSTTNAQIERVRGLGASCVIFWTNWVVVYRLLDLDLVSILADRPCWQSRIKAIRSPLRPYPQPLNLCFLFSLS